MKKIHLFQAAQWMEGELLCSKKNIFIQGISRDTREIKAGELYFALQGDHFDGHEFLREAWKKGAVGAVVSYIPPPPPKGWPLILVKETLKAMGDFAKHYRRQFRIPMVAITGSNGKTTVKELISHILSKKGRVLKTKGNWNNEIGVPLNLSRLESSHQYGVLEMGANHKGEIDYLASLIRPQIGVITSIGQAHLEGFGSIKGVQEAKGELLNHLEDQILVTSGENPWTLELAQRHKGPVITYGLEGKGRIRGKILESSWEGTWMECYGETFFLPLLGRHNCLNALGAIAVGLVLGVPLKDCLDFQDFSPPSLRLEKEIIHNIYFLKDCYNGNPTSLKSAMEVLVSLPAKGRKVLVLARLLELGKDSAKLHWELGKEAKKMGIPYVIVLGKEGKPFWQAFQEEGGKGWHFLRHKECQEFLQSFLKAEDMVLLKGSRAMGLEKILEKFKSSKAA